MSMDFTGQVVLVTGATRGIGAQLAQDFGALGAQLILTGTSQDGVEALKSKSGDNCQFQVVDFRDRQGTERFIDFLGECPRIDVCVNNAGINRIDYVDEARAEDWDDITAVNLKAPFLVTQKVAAIMKAQRYGRIVNIGSIFGVVSKQKRAIYSSTKHGLSGLTLATALELAHFNILANVVSPGFVLTDMTKSILTEDELDALAEQIPVGRLATPADISSVVLFLASTQNTYLTGQNIVVDGGFVGA